MPAYQNISAEDLAKHLFGNPFDPDDKGLIGEIRSEVQEVNNRLSSVLKLGWALFTVFLTATSAFVVDLLVRVTGGIHLP